MLSKMKLWFINQKNLLKMFRFVIITIILLIITWALDHRYTWIKSYIPKQLLLTVEVSVDFLSNISGVFLTISIFCFTTIVTVLNKYSSNVSPRMLQNFIDKTGVLSLYGIFVSGFFYSIISILLLQDLGKEEYVIAGSFGIIYSIITMIGFIIFSKQVLENIKIANIIEALDNDCEKLIEEEVELRKSAKRYDSSRMAIEIPILAQDTGYLFKVQSDDIIKELKGIKSEVVITKRLGEYTTKGEEIGFLKIIDDGKLDMQEKHELVKKISKLIVINIYKNTVDDYHSQIINLTEIANMALSPGTNDPNTAIVCINKISTLLGKLMSTANMFVILKENNNTKIIYKTYSVEEELYLVFSQIMKYSNGDPMVTRAILQGVYMIYMMADRKAKPSIKKFFDSAYEILISNFGHEMHLNKFEKIKNNLEKHSMVN